MTASLNISWWSHLNSNCFSFKIQKFIVGHRCCWEIDDNTILMVKSMNEWKSDCSIIQLKHLYIIYWKLYIFKKQKNCRIFFLVKRKIWEWKCLGRDSINQRDDALKSSDLIRYCDCCLFYYTINLFMTKK